MQDLNDKVTGGTLPAAEWNEVPSELQNVIEKTGQTLSSVDLDQLGKGIAVYVAAGDFYVDSGAANAYILGAVGSRQTPPSYVNGMKIRYIPANSNTGASTVNVSALGVKNLRRVDGTALQASDLQAGVPVSFQYDTTSGTFLKNGESLPDATETIKGKAEIATQAETDAGTDDARIVTPKKFEGAFTGSKQNLASPGYQDLPGGLQIRVGSGSANNDDRVTFDQPFSNAVLAIALGDQNTNAIASQAHILGYRNTDSAGFNLTVVSYTGSTSGNTGYNYIAIGY